MVFIKDLSYRQTKQQNTTTFSTVNRYEISKQICERVIHFLPFSESWRSYFKSILKELF